MSADTSELRVLAVDLGQAPDRVGARVSAAIRKTAYDIEGTAHVLVAKDTGNLSNSISTSVEGDGRFGAMSAEIGPTADYGYWVENGSDGPYEIPHAFGREGSVMHPGNSPQPFMGPAFDRHAPGLSRALAEAADNIL